MSAQFEDVYVSTSIQLSVYNLIMVLQQSAEPACTVIQPRNDDDKVCSNSGNKYILAACMLFAGVV